MVNHIVLIVICLTAVAFAQSSALTAQEFAKIIDKSTFDCNTGAAPRGIQNRVCPGLITVHQFYQNIPGNKETVRRYAPANFMRTLELCATRENNNATDWRKINVNRAKLGTQANSKTWTDCAEQMKIEQEDCKNAKYVLCAFKQGTSFACVQPTQLQRKCRTLETGDECNVIEALGDNRPTDVAEFRARTSESRRGCLAKKDETDAKCFAERNLAILLTRFPKGVDVKADCAIVPGLVPALNRCQDREEFGYPRIRVKATVVYRPGSKELNDCMAQLRRDEEDCKKVTQILCAYSYGVDVTCTKDNFTNRLGIQGDACAQAVSALKTESV